MKIRPNCRFRWFFYLVLTAPLGAHMDVASRFEIRLLTPLSSYRSRPGDPVSGVVVPACSEDGSPLPAGTIVQGVVKSVHRVGMGLVHETAALDLEFDKAQMGGASAPLSARLLSVDNARERVDGKGVIHGIRATASLSNRVAERLMMAARLHPMEMVPLFLLESGLFRFPEPEIQYEAGTELHLKLERGPSWPSSSGCLAPVKPTEQSPEVKQMVARLPYWTYTQRQHDAMDPTNLMFVGSRDHLERAFAAAGWTGSRSLNAETGFSIMRAIAEDHEDADAPMRTLMLDDRPPDLYRQKTLNTFEKRHHIRFWKRPDELNGATVWAASATQDVAASFSIRPFGLTHRIQGDLDVERDKVVSDLIFAGCVDEVAYVDRPAEAAAVEQRPRKGIRTDRRVAVILLNGCPEQAPVESSPVFERPPTAVRLIRRVTLVARNHIVRDNLVYRSYDAARLTFLAMRDWWRERASEHARVAVPVD